MTNKIIFFILTAFIFSAEITNITVQQRTDGSGIIDLNYDLLDTDNEFPSFTITIEISLDESEYSNYSLDLMSGDVGENVLPGTNKNIQIQAPENTFTNNAMFKIIASAQVVSGDLPFEMISISSSEGVTTYQNETINYNFQIMQNELTSTDLVAFLETFEFNQVADSTYNMQYGESEGTVLPIYDCSNYTELHISLYNYPDESETSWGCTDQNALNYNPDANSDNNTCAWQQDIGCTDPDAYNFQWQQYDDCSCYFLSTEYGVNYTTQQYAGCNWQNAMNQVSPALQGWFLGHFWEPNGYSSYRINVDLCNNSDALNYPEDIINNMNQIIDSTNITDECFNFVQTSDEMSIENDCVFECNQDYLEFNTSPPQGYNDGFVTEKVNIQHFSTEFISFQGSSFVISSGNGNKPVQFNFNQCVDAVIVTEMLNYYGLRIPTGGEWMKGARGNNERCWPWMSGSCEELASNSCPHSDDWCATWDLETCLNNVINCDADCDCSNYCSDNDSDCLTGCQENQSYCYEQCNNDLQEQQNTCQQNEVNCQNAFSECVETLSDKCIQDDRNTIVEILEKNPEEITDNQEMFLYNLHANRYFYQTLEDFDFQYEPIPSVDIQSYSSGISSFGLYDVIGNLPELVKYNNEYWLAGTIPTSQEMISFCKDDATIFDNNHAQRINTGESGSGSFSSFPRYGLRLIRTTQ